MCHRKSDKKRGILKSGQQIQSRSLDLYHLRTVGKFTRLRCQLLGRYSTSTGGHPVLLAISNETNSALFQYIPQICPSIIRPTSYTIGVVCIRSPCVCRLLSSVHCPFHPPHTRPDLTGFCCAWNVNHRYSMQSRPNCHMSLCVHHDDHSLVGIPCALLSGRSLRRTRNDLASHSARLGRRSD